MEAKYKYITFPLFLLQDIKGEFSRGKIRELKGIKRMLRSILQEDWKDKDPFGGLMISINENLLLKFLHDHARPEEDLIKEFDGVQLLAYIALRSIIGVQKYKAIKWGYVLSRMAGERKMTTKIPEHVCPYQSRRKRDKLIKALCDYWGLHYYAPQREIRIPLYSFVFNEEKLREKKKAKMAKQYKPKTA